TARGGGQGGTGSVTFTGIEAVIGAQFGDSLSGSGASERFDGHDGNDTLSGGLGNDLFVFAAPPGGGNVDGVTDFVSGTDKLAFDATAFNPIGPGGDFSAGDARFASGAGLSSGQDASDRLIYNTSTGELFYDSDGNGSAPSQRVAVLSGAPVLVATDITVTGQPQTVQPTAGDDSLAGTQGND